MLSAILKKEACAECRFCCAFRRQSLWETPLFTKENKEAIDANPALVKGELLRVKSQIPEEQTPDAQTESALNGSDNFPAYFRYDLSNCYKTDDPEEEAPCPYLSENGCVLSAEEKPWDCKIWPLRVMQKGETLVIALTPTCPEINKLSVSDVEKFVKENLQESLFAYAKAHPYLIKEYREGFLVLVAEEG